MIVPRINSGLGNQLFQYAAARHLAILNETTLKLDISYYQNDTRRTFALNHFAHSTEIAEPSKFTVIKLRRPRWRHEFYVLLNRVRSPKRQQLRLVKERHFHFDPEILKARGDIYLDGYWQSEKYFLPCQAQVRNDLTFKTEPDPVNRVVLDRITRSLSLGIHVRRGDYVSNPRTQEVHGLCSIEYYRRAVEYVRSRIGPPSIFVFSDEPGWVRENIDVGLPFEVVDCNKAGKDYEDLRLLSHCQHHVIANSTFGWWGAWLADRPGQIVIAPAQWTKAQIHNTKDVVPDRWIRL